MFIQFQLVMIVSAPSFRYKNKGARLTKKAALTAVFTWVVAQAAFRGWGRKVVTRGKINSVKTTRRLEVISSAVGCIATTWICTKSFWFLRPTDELLSFRSIRVSLGV